MIDRPESTNTGSWIDAADPPLPTYGCVATLLVMSEVIHDKTLDAGQHLLLRQAIEALDALGRDNDD